MQLVPADVQRHDVVGAVLQEHLREPARRRPHVQAPGPCHREPRAAPYLEGVLQLERTPADPAPQDPGCGAGVVRAR